jgi:hypothetical protein
MSVFSEEKKSSQLDCMALTRVSRILMDAFPEDDGLALVTTRKVARMKMSLIFVGL